MKVSLYRLRASSGERLIHHWRSLNDKPNTEKRMQPTAIVLVICGIIIFSGCSSKSTEQPSSATATTSPSPAAPTIATTAAANATPAAAPGVNSSSTKAKFDACTLLTSDDVKAVQGEAVKEAKPSDRVTGNFVVTQCYYELPTTSNSISLTLTENNSEQQGVERVRDFWERTFGQDEKKGERKREREREKEKLAKPENEEEEAQMEPVRGVGDEAFWSGSRVGGALYVLKRDRFIRISVGGKGDNQAKLQKSKTLAQKALRHW
jgi:hypothetical protein